MTSEHNPMPDHPPVGELRAIVERGGAQKYHDANAGKGKLFVRERVRLLVDEGSFVEDGIFANVVAGDLPADGVITGSATIQRSSVTSFTSAQYSVIGSSYSVGSSMWLYRPQLIHPWRFVASKNGDFRYQGWT